MNRIYQPVAVLALLFFFMPGLCQDGDTLIYRPADTGELKKEPRYDSIFLARHSPRTATLCAALLPGLGQIYNRKYWKVPIVYAGFGGLTYGTIYNADRYKYYKDKYKYMLDSSLVEWSGITIKEAEVYKNFHKRYRDLFVIMTAGFYVLQILDATVDAYLIDYDISEDLTLKINPAIITSQGGNLSVGLKCCLSY